MLRAYIREIILTGRPSSYRPEIGRAICLHLAEGGSLREWCAREGNPHFSTVYDWLESVEGFADDYARARERQAHNDGDRMNQLAEQLKAGEIAPDVARVMADILKWTAGKRLPKSYGDKVALTGDSSGPIMVTWGTPTK